MNFTQDWFSNNIRNFEQCMLAIPEKTIFLEIGAFEGRATCWMLENTSVVSIICVDPYAQSVFDPTIDMREVERRFWQNTTEVKKNTQIVSSFKDTSYKALAQMISSNYKFDFIYVDGSHAPDVAMTDACMAWGLLKKNGVMLFDDYQYPHEKTKAGIDAFLDGFEGQYGLILSNYQLAIQKK